MENWPSCTQRLWAMQNPHFGLKIKIPKNMSKAILQIISTCTVQKTAPKNTKYSRNEKIWKIGHHASKGYSPCKILTLAQTLKFQKNMSKSILQIMSSSSSKKLLQKTLYIGEMRAFGKSAIVHAKAIAHAKSSLWLKN